MAAPCTNNADEVIEKVVSAKVNADKFDKFVNGGETETVQLGEGAETPVIRNAVRQMLADASWARAHIADAPEGDISLNNATAMQSTASRTLAERFAEVVNVRDYGAKGDGSTDDTAAIQAAITAGVLAGKPTYVPYGTYIVSSPILLPSHGRLFGCGDRSVLKAVAGYDNELDVVCNDKRIKNTDYTADGASQDREEDDVDVDIAVWDICIDGNVWSGLRYASDSVSNSGCGLMLSGVRDAVIDNVTVKNSMGHAINITDTYVKTHSGSDISGRTRVFTGYSQNIVISNCTIIDPYLDDGITTHVAKDCLISNCRCVFDYEGKASINNRAPQAGIEIDDGSENVSVVNCLVSGFGCGTNIKAHGYSPAAFNVSVSNCVYKNVETGIFIGHAFSSSADLTGYSLEEETASGFFIKNITIDGLDSKPLSYSSTSHASGYAIHTARNVFIDGMSISNVNPNVGFDNYAYNATKVYVRNVTVRGEHNKLVAGATVDGDGNTVPAVVRPRSGLFNTGNTGNFLNPGSELNIEANPGIEFENINVDEVGYALNVVQDRNGIVTKIDGVHLLVDSQPLQGSDDASKAVVNLSYGRGATVKNVTAVDLTRRHCIRSRYHYAESGYSSNLTDYSQCLSPRVNVAQNYYPKNNEAVGALVFDEFTEAHPNIRFVSTFCISGSTAPSESAPDMYDEQAASTAYQTALYLKANSLSGASSANGGSQLGRSDRPWTEVFANTGAINTSDARFKLNVEDPSEALMRAWGKVNFKVFQFQDAYSRKGESARLHVGVVAQAVAEAFASEGLDAGRYGLFCYDQWDDEYEEMTVVDAEAVYDENGNMVEPEQTHVERRLATPAGDKYSIRYEEALALECAFQRWLGEKREARIAALEARLAGAEE